MLAVLIECGRPDHMQFAAGQHGFENVGRIHRTFSRASPNDGVQLIDEHQNLPMARLDLLEDRLEALLELATILGSSDQGSHVQHDEAFVLQAFWHISFDNSLG